MQLHMAVDDLPDGSAHKPRFATAVHAIAQVADTASRARPWRTQQFGTGTVVDLSVPGSVAYTAG
jgi:hypothetical protein